MNLLNVRPQNGSKRKPNFIAKDFDHFINDFFNRGINDILGADSVKSTPAVNISETEAAYQLALAAPGYEKEAFTIDLDKHQLTISVAEKTEEATTKENKSLRREFKYAAFSRSFKLPQNIVEDEIAASYVNGILTLTIPKAKKVDTKKSIQIS